MHGENLKLISYVVFANDSDELKSHPWSNSEETEFSRTPMTIPLQNILSSLLLYQDIQTKTYSKTYIKA